MPPKAAADDASKTIPPAADPAAPKEIAAPTAGDDTKDAPAKVAPKAEPKPPADNADPFAEPAPKKTDAAPPAAGKQAVIEPPAMRDWQDDTGEYRVRGKLVRISDSTVRLLKDTGKYTTVPMDRLCETDRQYVAAQSAANRADLLSQSAPQ